MQSNITLFNKKLQLPGTKSFLCQGINMHKSTHQEIRKQKLAKRYLWQSMEQIFAG